MNIETLKAALAAGGLPGLSDRLETVPAPRATLKKLGAAFLLSFEIVPGAGPTKVYFTDEGMRIVNPSSPDSEMQTLPDAVGSLREMLRDVAGRARRALGDDATPGRVLALVSPARPSLAVESLVKGRELAAASMGLPEGSSHLVLAEAGAALLALVQHRLELACCCSTPRAHWTRFHAWGCSNCAHLIDPRAG